MPVLEYFQQFCLNGDRYPKNLPWLHGCVVKGDIRTVLSKLNEGVNVNERCEKTLSATALHMAADCDHSHQVIIVEMLLKFGANVNAVDANGNTALHIALQRNVTASDHIVRILINNGADVNACNVYNCTPLDYAFKYRSINDEPLICKLLLSGVVDKFDGEGNTILMNLIFKENHRAVDVLIKHNRFTRVKKRYDNNTLLHIASCTRFEIIDSILKLGIDIDAVNDKGEQALHIACVDYCPEYYSIQYLLDCYLDFTIVNELVTKDRPSTWGIVNIIWGNSAKLYALNQSVLHNSITNALKISYPQTLISNDYQYSEKVHAEFVEQVGKLKITVIGETSVTLYDFLMRDDNEVVKLLENDSIVQYLSKYYGVYVPVLPIMVFNYRCPPRNKFNYGLTGCEVPHYHGNIYCRFQLGLVRKSIIDKCKRLIIRCCLNHLPLKCLEVILFQLANSDLNTFIEAFEQCA